MPPSSCLASSSRIFQAFAILKNALRAAGLRRFWTCLSDRSAGASELNPITGCDSTDMTSLLIWSILSPFADISKLARNEDAVSGYQVVQSKDAEHNRLVTQVTNPDQFGKG